MADAATANLMHSAAPIPEKGEVLSHEDAALYRSIFTAQSKGYWRDADLMISQLGDKRLMGHVLADRYSRRPANLNELQDWLTAYHELPEASDMYKKARALPESKGTKFIKPTANNIFARRGYGFGTSTGFHTRNNTSSKGLTPPLRHAVARIANTIKEGAPETAKTMLEATIQQSPLPEQELTVLQSKLAAGFFYNGDIDEAHRLTDTAYMQNNARALWINGLSNFKLSRPKEAATSFINLAKQDDLAPGDYAAASFWAYRSLKLAGQKDEANYWLKEAASEPHSFYGLLALYLNGENFEATWSWHLPELSKRTVDTLAAFPAGARALALVQIGQNKMAEAELSRLNPAAHRGLLDAMIALAEKGHMASLAMKLGGLTVDGDGKHYDAALYPLPPWQPSGGFHVDRALIYALIRHESQFDPMAVSSQGACGLMQLMPATAEGIRGKRATTKSTGCSHQLFDPETNINLGQRYVRLLSEQPAIGDNLVLLLTAYNGGPGRLLQRDGKGAHADPLLFLESLPVQETHDYVQQVLMQYWGYRARLNQSLKSLDQLAHGQWPRYNLHDTPPADEAALSQQDTGFAVASNEMAR